jgi:hypothetical protein
VAQVDLCAVFHVEQRGSHPRLLSPDDDRGAAVRWGEGVADVACGVVYEPAYGSFVPHA